MKTIPSRITWLFMLIPIFLVAGFVWIVLPGQAAPAAGPVISVPAITNAAPNSVVSIPVTFTSNGNSIASVVFSIDYDQTYLAYENQVTTPYSFSLPANFVGSCIPDILDTDGELDCFIIYMTAPLQALPDGVVATIQLRTGNPPGLTNAAVNFSTTSPNFSFGDTAGQSIAGTASNGLVAISGTPGAAQANLVLDKTASSAQVWASTVFTYTMTVTNNGPDPSGTLILTDTLPAGVSFLGASGTGFSTCSIEAGNKMTCNGNNLANSGIATLNVRVMAPAVAGVLLNKAGVHGVASDPTLPNNFDEVSVAVEPWADLAVANSCLPDSSNSLLLNCKMKVSNLGPNVAFSVVLANSWSGPMGSYQNVSTSGGTCTPSGSILACNYSGLAAGDMLEATYQAEASATPLPCSIANVVASTMDLNLQNNTAESCPGTVYLPFVGKDFQGALPSISGVVKDGSGNPVSGVTVSDGAGHSAVTDGTGTYSIQNLAAGTYSITPTKTCYGFAPAQRQVVLTGSVSGVDFTATATCSISGKVTRSGGAALVGVVVSAGAGVPGLTDANGNYTITGLPANIYTVTPSKACYSFSSTVVSVSGPVSGINFTGASTCSVSGVITKIGGGALAGVLVSDGASHSTLTDANGAYTLSGLEGGSTTITPSRGCYVFNPISRTVNVVGQHFGQDFTATPNCSISGKVTQQNGTALAGVTVSIGASYPAITTLADGTYSFGNLGDGSYTVTPTLLNTTFSPSSSTVVLPPSRTMVDFTVSVQAGCYGGLYNMGFEYNGEWVFPATDHKAGYSQPGDPTKAGSRSLRTGILSMSDQVLAYSSAYQSVSIPVDATKVNLAFWMYPQTTEAPLSPMSPLILDPMAPDAVDAQYILVQDKNGNNYILMSIRSNSRSWTQYKFDLLQVVGQFIKGQTIKIWFGSYNDGVDGVTAMFVDEATLEVCQP